MPGIGAFLRDRQDEDERAALAALDGEWPPGLPGCGEIARAHIAAHPPARVLREVAASRERVAELLSRPHDRNAADEFSSCAQAVAEGGGVPGSGCADPLRSARPCDCGRDAAVAAGLRREALTWGDHPGHGCWDAATALIGS
jgi:hypothetical protein